MGEATTAEALAGGLVDAVVLAEDEAAGERPLVWIEADRTLPEELPRSRA